MGTLLGGGQKQGRRNQGPMGTISPSDLNGRYVNTIRIREVEDYAHLIKTSSPSPGFLDLPTALQVGAGAVTAIGY